PNRPDKFPIHLDRQTSPVRRHTRQRRDAGQERRVALDEVEEVLRRHAEQSRVRLILRNLDAQNRRPVHAAKGLEIAAVIEHGDVLGDPNRSCLRNGFIHHLLCELGRDAVFLDDVSHWTFSFVYCVLNPPRARATPPPFIATESATAETDRRTSVDRSWIRPATLRPQLRPMLDQESI